MVRLGLWGASLVVAVAVGCGGGSGGGGAAGTINVDTGGAGGNSASTGEAGGPGGATAGAGGATAGAGALGGAGGKGGAGGRGSSSATLAGTLTVTLDGAAVSYPSIIGGFNGLRVDISGYSADLTRSFAFSVYPNGMAAGSFTCALGGPTSMTMSYSVNFSPMNAAATTAGCMGTFTMIPTSADAGGRFVGTFSGTVGTVAATAGMVDVTLPPN